MIPALGIFLCVVGGLVWIAAVHAGHTTLAIAMPVAGVACLVVWSEWQERTVRDVEAAP